MAIFPQQKVTGPGGVAMTPDEVSRKRAVATALMGQAGNTSPVGHWTAALNRGLQGFTSSYDNLMANRAETEGMGIADALAAQNGLTGGGNPSPVAQALSGGGVAAASGDAASIREGLIARGLPEHIADGFIMNFQDESGLNPGINEINPTVPGSRGGFGLYQLTGPRRTAYEAFAADRGVDPSNADAQLDWLMYELQGPEAKAAQSIFAAGNAGEAGAAIVNNFLRPAEEHRNSRANRYLGAGSGVSPAPSASNVAGLTAAMGNPWFRQQYGDVAQALMGQQMSQQNAAYEAQLRQSDPAYQLDMQMKQAQLAKMMQPQVSEYDQRAAAAAQFGLTGDALNAYALTGEMMAPDPWAGTEVVNGRVVRMGDNGLEVIGDFSGGGAGQNPADFLALELRAEAAGLTKGTPEYQEFMLNGGRPSGGLPAATEALHQQAVLGGLTQGTPEYQEFMRTRGAGYAAGATTTATATAEQAIAAPSVINASEDTLLYIDELLNHPGLAGGTGADAFRALVPGTKERDFAARVEQLEGGAFLTAIDEMAGMGALSNQEGQTAKAAIARLSRAQSQSAFEAALEDYRRIIVRGRERAQSRIRADGTPMVQQGAPSTPAVPPLPAGSPIDPAVWPRVWEAMSEEERKLFEQ